MQTIQDVMTRDVQTVSPQETIQRAAQLMNELNVGAIPVVEGGKLVGMITDRDIAVRSVAIGQDPTSTKVTAAMSTDVRTCTTDQSVQDLLKQMADVQIRRIPVLDDSGQIVGIVSLGDVATRHSADVDRTLGQISAPSEPDRSTTGR